MADKQKRITLSLKRKIDLIDMIEDSGKKKVEIANEFGISPSTLTGIFNDREKLRQQFYGGGVDVTKKRFRTAVQSDIEDELLKWFQFARSSNIPVSGPVMSAKAEEFARNLGKTEWVCSEGWLGRFKKRHNIIFKRMTEEDMANSTAPQIAVDALHKRSSGMPADSETVRGYDFNEGVDYHKLFSSYSRFGFQATSLAKAIEEINKMIECKKKPVPEESKCEINLNPCGREQSNCTIFLSYTSNMISAGTREVIRYLVQNNMVDCIVTTAGGVEEDFIKCLGDTYIGDFSLQGRELRSKGINRIGNLLVPNENYCQFEDWLMPILDTLLEEQKEQGVLWTPSKVIQRLGKEVGNTDSVYYWAYKNNIPVFCPALTDGSLGDIMFFHSFKNPGLILDIIEDVRRLNSQALCAINSGMIILGGGLCKHHTCNANLMRNGADFSVFINTASEYDGSDSGARPDEAISWGKIKMTATPVKVYGDASLIFPILVAETFARQHPEFKAVAPVERI